jgi:hypothetical protein
MEGKHSSDHMDGEDWMTRGDVRLTSKMDSVDASKENAFMKSCLIFAYIFYVPGLQSLKLSYLDLMARSWPCQDFLHVDDNCKITGGRHR